MAILAFGNATGILVHYISPALRIGAGMTFIAIIDCPGIDEFAMRFMNDL